MDIKEVNGVVAFQNMMSKAFAGSVANQVIGSDFASLIGQTADAVIPEVKDGAVDSASGQQKIESNKSQISEKDDVAKKEKRVKKSDKPARKQVEKKKCKRF